MRVLPEAKMMFVFNFIILGLEGNTGVWCAYPLTEFIVAWIGLAFYISIKRKERLK